MCISRRSGSAYSKASGHESGRVNLRLPMATGVSGDAWRLPFTPRGKEGKPKGFCAFFNGSFTQVFTTESPESE